MLISAIDTHSLRSLREQEILVILAEAQSAQRILIQKRKDHLASLASWREKRAVARMECNAIRDGVQRNPGLSRDSKTRIPLRCIQATPCVYRSLRAKRSNLGERAVRSGIATPLSRLAMTTWRDGSVPDCISRQGAKHAKSHVYFSFTPGKYSPCGLCVPCESNKSH